MISRVSPAHTTVSVLRVVVALLLIIHGIARIALRIVDDFGTFLSGVGFPLGTALAWGITGIESLGGVLFRLEKWVRPLALYFAAQLVLGIVLVHAQEGWFVVGAGRNGVEYSVLLIAVLLGIAYAAGSASTEQTA